MTVIGISGSPIADSNTDRALRIALGATGQETEFIKLSDYSYQPCRACLGCEETNICVLKDDATVLAQKIRYADALIVAGYTPYGSLDGRTKSFLERLWQLRHQHGFMRGKPGGIIITSSFPPGNPMRSLRYSANDDRRYGCRWFCGDCGGRSLHPVYSRGTLRNE